MRAILSRAILLGLLLPQVAVAWETRIGAGPSTSGKWESNDRDGLNVVLGIQGRIRHSAMFMRGELMGNRFHREKHAVSKLSSFYTAWTYHFHDPSLMVGPALLFQGRPEGHWSPYVIGGVGYCRAFLTGTASANGQPIYSYHNSMVSRWDVNYGAGLQAKMGRTTGFLELRRHDTGFDRPLQLTIGFGL